MKNKGKFLKPRRVKTRCPYTGKIRWFTELDAKMALSNVKAERVYKCPDCKKWHITRKKEWK